MNNIAKMPCVHARLAPAWRVMLAGALLVSVPAAHSQAIAHYVSTSGNDGNTGTLASPWRTIAHAGKSVQPGGIINIRAGVYHEAVTPTVSGSASGGSVTFQSYAGERAIIDGSGVPIVNGQSGLFNISNVSYIVIRGLEIRNFTTRSASLVPIGIFVTGMASHIQLLNNHVHNITTTAGGCSNALGIAVYGTQASASIDNVVISGNEVDHNKTGCSETITLNGNVQHFTVSNNLIHDNDNIGIDVIGFEGTAKPVGAMCGNDFCDRARDGLITGNSVYNITSFGNPAYGNQYAADGIYVDGGTRVVIDRNTIHDTDLNVELASEHAGKATSYVTLRNNLIYNGNSNGISIGGYDAKRGGSDHCIIVNNTLYHNDTKNTGSGEFQVQYYATNNVFKNNIVYAGTAQNLFINDFTSSSSDPVDGNYNLYYSTDAANAQWIWQGTAYTGFSSYQSVTHADVNSLFADPQFRDPNTPNLDVSASSPAVHAGIILANGLNGILDFAGNPRIVNGQINVGAYQK